MTIEQILALIAAAGGAYSKAIEIATEVAQTFGSDDQAALQTELARLKAQSDAAHAALQAKLAARLKSSPSELGEDFDIAPPAN